MTDTTFSQNLIKGKVAEMIFEQMLRDAGGFTVLGFGYEKILPELARRQDSVEAERTMEIIRRAPDFAVIKHDNNKVYLIEVKYMRALKEHWVKSAAEKMLASWDPSYLFIATPDGFYFDAAKKVTENEGRIDPLNNESISQELQDSYLKVLKTFINM